MWFVPLSQLGARGVKALVTNGLTENERLTRLNAFLNRCPQWLSLSPSMYCPDAMHLLTHGASQFSLAGRASLPHP